MQKAWSWSVTGYNFVRQKDHEQIWRICRQVGLAGVEGAPELFPDESPTQLEDLARRYRQAGVGIPSFHLPFEAGDDLASFYETARRRAVERIGTWMERASRLGATVAIQHPTTNRFAVEVEGLDHYLRQLDRSLQELLPKAEQLGLTLALENMLPPDEGGSRLGTRPAHFARIAESCAHPALGFCLDTGHALVAEGPAGVDGFLAAMGSRLAAFHLADNAGDRDSHLAPGRGLVDWGRVFRGAAGLGFAGCMCIETPPFAQGPEYRPEAWTELVAQTDGLARQALANP